jgi:type IV pilus assembly protein PilO
MNRITGLLSNLSMQSVFIMGLIATAGYWTTLYNDGSGIEQQVQELVANLQAEEKKKKDTDASLAYAKQMQERVGKLSQVYQEISKQLPATLYSVQLNKDIESFAMRAGVAVKIKSPGVNSVRGIIEEVPYQVTIEGDYSQLAQFVYIVSTAERMSRVQNIRISEPEQGGVKLKLEAQVVAYKLAPEPKKPESPDGTGKKELKNDGQESEI